MLDNRPTTEAFWFKHSSNSWELPDRLIDLTLQLTVCGLFANSCQRALNTLIAWSLGLQMSKTPVQLPGLSEHCIINQLIIPAPQSQLGSFTQSANTQWLCCCLTNCWSIVNFDIALYSYKGYNHSHSSFYWESFSGWVSNAWRITHTRINILV